MQSQDAEHIRREHHRGRLSGRPVVPVAQELHADSVHCAVAMRFCDADEHRLGRLDAQREDGVRLDELSTFIRAIGSVCLQREKQTGTATFKCCNAAGCYYSEKPAGQTDRQTVQTGYSPDRQNQTISRK